jgi:hypothetical protein
MTATMTRVPKAPAHMVKTPRIAKPVKRTFTVLARHAAGSEQALSVAAVRLTVGVTVEEYDLTSEPTGDGLAVTFAKRTGDRKAYRVEVGEVVGCRCECDGFRYRSKCKHIDFTLRQVAEEQQKPRAMVCTAVDPFDCHEAE